MNDRFFVEGPLIPGQEIELSTLESFHLSTVLRKKKHATVELVNGKNQLAKGSFRMMLRKKAIILILKVVEGTTDYSLILCQGLLSPTKLSWLIEKATELGVTEIRLFPTKQSKLKTLSREGLSRLQHLTIAAIKQCGRLSLPSIVWINSLKESLCEVPSFFGKIDSQAPLLSASSLHHHAAIFIGPESGFTENEELFLQHHGVQPVSLHPHVLRAETAAIVGLTILSQKVLVATEGSKQTP